MKPSLKKNHAIKEFVEQMNSTEIFNLCKMCHIIVILMLYFLHCLLCNDFYISLAMADVYLSTTKFAFYYIHYDLTPIFSSIQKLNFRPPGVFLNFPFNNRSGKCQVSKLHVITNLQIILSFFKTQISKKNYFFFQLNNHTFPNWM